MALVLLSGCSVATSVTVTELPSGRGVLAVTVTFDHSALASAGGLSALRSQLDTAGLAAAGWSVSGPTAVSSGGAVVVAAHAFADPAQLSQLAGEVAGPGVFDLDLSTHRTFWHTQYRLGGDVDLTCGIDCFGDSALARSTGSPVGVAAGPASTLDQVFTFKLAVTLPGRRLPLGWSVPLGRSVGVSGATQTLVVRDVVGAAVVAGLLLLAAVGWLWWLVRRRRRRRRGAHFAA